MLRKLKEKLTLAQFWWAKRNLRDGIDFEISKTHEEPTFRFLTGEYRDVEIQFGIMKISDEDQKMLDFVTYVVYNPHDADVSKGKFVRLTANLVRVVLGDMAVAGKVMNESRTNDFDEPNEEREFHEEVDPLLETRVSKRKPRKKAVRTDALVHPEVQQPTKPKRPRARSARKIRPNRK